MNRTTNENTKKKKHEGTRTRMSEKENDDETVVIFFYSVLMFHQVNVFGCYFVLDTTIESRREIKKNH